MKNLSKLLFVALTCGSLHAAMVGTGKDAVATAAITDKDPNTLTIEEAIGEFVAVHGKMADVCTESITVKQKESGYNEKSSSSADISTITHLAASAAHSYGNALMNRYSALKAKIKLTFPGVETLNLGATELRRIYLLCNHATVGEAAKWFLMYCTQVKVLFEGQKTRWLAHLASKANGEPDYKWIGEFVKAAPNPNAK